MFQQLSQESLRDIGKSVPLDWPGPASGTTDASPHRSLRVKVSSDHKPNLKPPQ